jgi:predicted histone-like DNA-binding protein
MALFYNKVQRKNPAKQSEPAKWYPVLRSVTQVTEKEVGKRIADETTLNPKEAEMAISQLLKVLKAELLAGNTVKLGDWGTFHLTVNSNGVATEQEVTATLIKQVNINFLAGDELREALNKAEFKPASSLSD